MQLFQTLVRSMGLNLRRSRGRALGFADEEPLVIQSAARALAELMPFSRSALADLRKLRMKEYDDHGLTGAILERAITRMQEK